MPRCCYILKKHVNQSYTKLEDKTTATTSVLGNGKNATISNHWQPKKTINVALKQQQQKHDTPISLNEEANYSICASNNTFVNQSGEYQV